MFIRSVFDKFCLINNSLLIKRVEAFEQIICFADRTVGVYSDPSSAVYVFIDCPSSCILIIFSGTFESIEANTRTHAIRIGLSAQTSATPQARLHIEQLAKIAGVGSYHPRQQLTKERDAYTVALKRTTTWIELIDN